MPESIKRLIEKFVMNECSPEEVERLIAYFERQEIDEAFPQVEEVLAQLQEKRPYHSSEESHRLYKQILKKTERVIRRHKVYRKRHNNIYWAVAAVFVGIIGVSVYFGFWKSEHRSETLAPVATISAQPDTGVEL